MEIRFAFTEDLQKTLTWDDIDTIESGKIGKSKSVIARFVVDENNKPVGVEKAEEILGKLTLAEIQPVLEEFAKVMSEGAVTPTNAAS